MRLLRWLGLALLLAPFAPHLGEEMWARLGGPYSVHQQPWPRYDEGAAADETVTLVVQVNGKVRDKIEVPAAITDEEARVTALGSPQVARLLDGKQPAKVVYVPRKLVNIVVR